MNVEIDSLVFVVEDDPLYRELLQTWLEEFGFEVAAFANGEDCLAELRESIPVAICLDLGLPGVSGIEILRQVRQRALRLPILVLTGDSRPNSIVQVMKAGANDYLIKPVDHQSLLTKVEQAIQSHQADSRQLTQMRIQQSTEGGQMVGQSPSMQQLCMDLLKVSGTDITVLLDGESGTGKELAANFIHQNSSRRNKPFVVVNCSAIPDSLFESEFFGHEKGSFTGAGNQQIGYIEQADGGTLFLDEVGELPKSVQPKLLRVLQDRCFRRIGDKANRRSDFRLISATNRNLSAAVQEGAFRQDLYFRLAVYEIDLPPLRTMTEDIPMLVNHFIRKHQGARPHTDIHVPASLMSILTKYSWPGNIRELENSVQRALLTCDNHTFQLSDFLEISRVLENAANNPEPQLGAPPPTKPQSLEDSSRNFIIQALNRNQGNISAVTRELNIGRPRFYRLMKKYGLENLVNEIRYKRVGQN